MECRDLARSVAGVPLAPKHGTEFSMKDNIHPQYVTTTVKCGCGNQFVTRSVKSELKVDICNACHPFYTGKLKYVDTAGRIEKFQNKYAEGSYASLQRAKKGGKAAKS